MALKDFEASLSIYEAAAAHGIRINKAEGYLRSAKMKRYRRLIHAICGLSGEQYNDIYREAASHSPNHDKRYGYLLEKLNKLTEQG